MGHRYRTNGTLTLGDPGTLELVPTCSEPRLETTLKKVTERFLLPEIRDYRWKGELEKSEVTRKSSLKWTGATEYGY